MSAADVYVTASGKVQVLQPFNNAGSVVLTNNGPATLYLDDQSTVSDTANDYVLKPGAAIEWEPGKPCWAIADAVGKTALVGIAKNVRAFTSPALGGSGAQAVTVLYRGTLDAINAKNPLDVRAYQSVRIVTVGVYAPGNTGQFIECDWYADINNGSVRSDVMYPSPNALLNSSRFDWTLDVVSPYLAFFFSGGAMPTPPTVVVLGYAGKMPTLMFEPGNDSGFIAPKNGGSAWFSQLAIPVANDGAPISIPVWSGRIRIELHCLFNGAPTAQPQAIVYDTILGNFFSGDVFRPVAQTAGTSRGFIDIPGGRRPRSVYLFKGTGYVNVTPDWGITFYGSEDN